MSVGVIVISSGAHVHAHMCRFSSKTLYSLYSKCMHICIPNWEYEQNRQSKFAIISAPHSPVEVQSGVTHGE